MITFSNIALQRGKSQILENVDLRIHAGEHIGVVGRNGCGKSSLFKLLLGELHVDSGDLHIPADWTMAHMAQEVDHSDRTAIDYVLDGDRALRSAESAAESARARADDHALAEALAALESADGYTARPRAETLLQGLGFKLEEMEKPVADFSGGWRIRLNLARALMCPAQCLLLDEPTNHLDMDATLWLEQWLARFPGTLLLISHDRDFLDNICQFTIHIDKGRLKQYRGNYSAFEVQRAAHLAQQQAEYEKQTAVRAHMEAFVRRFKAKATKAKQAQSRIKALQKMEEIAPAHVDSPFHFHFANADKFSTPLCRLDQVRLGYEDKTILDSVELDLMPGSRIGLLGPNGAGKSTLIKALVGELPPLGGKRSLGDNTEIAYFAQHQLEALDLGASPLLHIQRISPDASEQSIRDFLGSFDFHGDKATGSIAHFSGGEKARLALALIAWQKPNCLLLDEPTNHLDLEMRHALTLALQDYNGAVVVVSHDRHLLRNCVDEFLLVADGTVSEFNGDLEDYSQWLSQFRQNQSAAKHSNPASDKQDRKAQRRAAANVREQLSPLKKSVARLEKEMETLQSRLADCETRLANPELYSAERNTEMQELLIEQGRDRQQLEQLEERWMEQLEELEALQQELSQ